MPRYHIRMYATALRCSGGTLACVLYFVLLYCWESVALDSRVPAGIPGDTFPGVCLVIRAMEPIAQETATVGPVGPNLCLYMVTLSEYYVKRDQTPQLVTGTGCWAVTYMVV